MTEALIKIEGLYKLFGDRPQQYLSWAQEGATKELLLAESGHTLGLRNINLSINRGEIFVIMGLSGSGKSTLVRHINRLIEPTAGRLLIDGQNLLQMNVHQLRLFRQQRLAMVFQRFALLPHCTVVDNVALGLEAQNVDKKSRTNRAMQWLETVGLEGYHNQYPAQLSGGQQQRVGLARALCTDADILLMDEAFSALDPLIRTDMQTQLLELQQRFKKTIVFITHDLDEALRLGDRIAILRDGELSQIGVPSDILLRPAGQYVRQFVQDVNITRVLRVSDVMRSVQADMADSEMLMEPQRDRSITADTRLEAVIPQLLMNAEPISVVGEQGQLLGTIGREDMNQVLQRQVGMNDVRL